MYEDQEIINNYLEKNITNDFTLTTEKEKTDEIFKSISLKAKNFDATLEKAVLAESVKVIKSIENIEGRIKKAIKQSEEIALNRISKTKSKIYPDGKLQERFDSFLEYYIIYGREWIDNLVNYFDPLKQEYIIVHLE